MARVRISSTVVVLFILLLGTSVIAAEKITWRGLTVPVDPRDDPYFGLNFDQRKNLESIFGIAKKRLGGLELTSTEQKEEKEAALSLSESGINVELLMKKNRIFLKKLKLQRSTVRNEWDNKKIEIPGYVIPLEYSDEKVTEFILVPYVGACIHTPPPPANQILHVSYEKGVFVGGLFTPVRVSGKLSVNQSRQSVRLSDGASEFQVGYSLAATGVRIIAKN